MSTGGYQLTVNSDGSTSSPPAYYSSNGPSLPHLVAFTLATIGVAFTLGETPGLEHSTNYTAASELLTVTAKRKLSVDKHR